MKLWVVEIWNEEKERWEATVDTGIKRQSAREKMWSLRRMLADAHFRVQKYVPKQDVVYIRTYYDPNSNP